MQKRFLKNHVNFQRYKVPSRWIIRSNTTEHSLVLASQKTTKLLKTEHLKSVLFYIKKYIGRKAKRPRFLIKPRYWLTAKAKASRMGKGKGALDCLFLLIHPGARLLVLPSIQLLALIRLLRSIRIRLPFTLTYLDSEEW